MDTLKQALGKAVKSFRSARDLPQDLLGSQAFVSDLERGRKTASLVKLHHIGMTLGIHPLSVIAAAYRIADPEISRDELLRRIEKELIEVGL
ncbi:helix-turn-helix domain-containing protein [Aquipseudomonas alcaligenes]|uniref:helix-turn-helix domain-containing protein n=1 Tax=Aquipseudomonas alcaligenes TaxID=43263 RepID=UPI00365498C3